MASTKKRRIGILTAGGDSPGLNAAIRGFAEAESDGIIQDDARAEQVQMHERR